MRRILPDETAALGFDRYALDDPDGLAERIYLTMPTDGSRAHDRAGKRKGDVFAEDSKATVIAAFKACRRPSVEAT